MSEKKPTKRQQEAARRYVREHGSLIMLHALYQRWGLPTARLAPMFKARGSR